MHYDSMINVKIFDGKILTNKNEAISNYFTNNFVSPSNPFIDLFYQYEMFSSILFMYSI